MELLFYVAAFYLWQCVRFLPAGGAAFVSLASLRLTVQRGPGLRLLSPWPVDLGLVVGGLPFELSSTRAYSSSPFVRAGASGVAERNAPLDGRDQVRVRGFSLVAGGKAFLRAASYQHAAHLASFLGALATGDEEGRKHTLERLLKRAFDLSAAREVLSTAKGIVRPLEWCCAVYFLMVAAVLPLLVWRLDGEAAWRILLLPLLAVHVASLVAMVLVERRLPDPAPGLAERVVVCALFPPALLRAPVELVSERLAAFHPATVAAALMPRERFDDFLRREIAEIDNPAWSRHGGSEAPDERERGEFLAVLRSGLTSLLGQLGDDASRLSDRRGLDPAAAGYCPLCYGEYRDGGGSCRACGVDTVSYPPRGGEAERRSG